MILKEPIEQAVWHSLEYYNYDDAIFLAQRFLAESSTDDAVWLLATCFFRAGKFLQVHHLLKARGLKTPQCRFLFARTCFELDKLAECEKALLSTAALQCGGANLETFPVTEFPDSASSVLHLLGLVCLRTERIPKAIEYFSKSLKLNPFQWSSYEKLCDLGDKLDASKIFALTPELTSQINLSVFNAVNQNSVILGYSPGTVTTKTASRPPMTTPTSIAASITSYSPHMNLISNLAPSSDTTPSLPTPCNQGFLEIASSPCMSKPPTMPTKGRAASKIGRNLLSTSSSVNLPISPSFGIAPIAETPPPPTFGSGDEPGSQLMFITPSPVQGMDSLSLPDPRAPSKKVMSRKGGAANTRSKPPVFSSNSVNSNVQPPAFAQQQSNVQQSKVRRSSRLFASSNSVKENTKNSSNRISSPKAGKKGRLSGNKSSRPNSAVSSTGDQIDTKPEIYENNPSNPTSLASGCLQHTHTTAHLQQLQTKQISLAEGLLRLLQDLGNSYQSLSSYDCSKALEQLQLLPYHHHNTSWILTLVGRAHFELADYNKSINAFAEAHRLAPYDLEGMEIYSTALWHLQKEIVLSTLAQQLVANDKKSPQSWCVAGNCFSLQKEHDVAIRFFQRAIQVDPYFTYAYTLLGHEYVLTEELDKAIACFRNAVRLDSRHYNAWYGIGMIYYKQEKYTLAEVHFKKALSINPGSSVLMCHVGVVQHALQHSSLALATLEKAIQKDPQNPLCKFHKASILFSSERHHEALKELEELKELVPRESLVYFLMGKVNKKLGNTHLALMNFSWAMDLDPKGANNQIKEAIDKRYISDEDEGRPGSPMVGAASQDADGPGIMSLGGQEGGGDTTPVRNLSSPEFPATPVFRYSMHDADNASRLGADDGDVLASAVLDSSVDVFQAQPGLDDSIGQPPALGSLSGVISPSGAAASSLERILSPVSGTGVLEGVDEDMQLQASESDESL